MYGVLHFGVASMYPLPTQVEKAYADADLVAFESDMRQMATPEFAAIIQARGTLPPGESLADSLTPDTWERLQAKARQLGWFPEQLAGRAAWHCASLLTSAALRQNGLSANLGLDTYLFQQTIMDGKELFCLESPEQQLQMLLTMQTESPEMMILGLLEELEAMAELSGKLLKLWTNGDAEGLSEVIQRNFSSLPHQREQLLYQRNQAWLELLLPLLKQGRKILVAVGAGHLVGPRSLPKLFQEKSFKVRQL